MQSSAWIALLRHIPAEEQSRFMLVTSSGTEIAIQSFLLVEQEFVVFKGRLSGTQDTGRVFFIPYAHIDYLGFSKPVKDEEFYQMFGSLTVPPPSLAAANSMEGPSMAAPSVSPTESEPPPAMPETPETPVITPAAPGSGSRPLIRSEILDRFRSRPGQP